VITKGRSFLKLTKQTDYAFRVLMYLAVRDSDKLATITEVVEIFDISRDSVMKIVQKLAKAGFIDAIRGKSGGMRLGRQTSDINLKDVVVLMEPSLKPVNCDEPICRIRQGCRLKTILFDATEAFLNHINQYSLADVVQTDSETVNIINLLQGQ
jgi:Rrf2 family nitric oxide-sensitive transcriptional repressor